MASTKQTRILLVAAALMALAYGARVLLQDSDAPDHTGRAAPAANPSPSEHAPRSRPVPRDIPRARDSDVQRVIEAHRNKRSGLVVEVDATVIHLLGDDNKGKRHQRFLVEIATGSTLMIAHNIDLAQRVPLRKGERIRIRGQYEWNDKGGVLHWTHHDPRGRRPGGWILHNGRRYK